MGLKRVENLKISQLSRAKRVIKSSPMLILLVLLGLGLFSNVFPQVQVTQASTDKQVMQAVLLIKQSTQTGNTLMFPAAVANDMNISYTIFNADAADLTNAVLYDGQVGRFSLIAVTPDAVRFNLNSTERTLLDNYEEEFGVAEALLGPVHSTLNARYGVSSLGASPRFNSLKWTNNGLTNFMNTSMYLTTLAANTTVYAYGGNETQTNPVVWSYSSRNIIRIASSIQSLSPFDGDKIAYWATFWLASKLSPADKILKFYWSLDIDDVMAMYSDSGIYGAPAVSNLYFNGSDVNYMTTNFLAQSGFNPTLAVEYYDVSNASMIATYPGLYNALTSNTDRFDFTPHAHELGGATSYSKALGIIRSDRNGISSWGFRPTLYYMVPGNYDYSNITASAITDSPVWYVAQEYSVTSDTVPFLKQKLSLFDQWSPTLFRVVRGEWFVWNLRTTEQMLNQSGQGTWDKFWSYNLQDILYGYASYWGGYRIEATHFPNWIYGRESTDAPALQLLKNITSIGILPVVPSRSWAMAENMYFIRNFKFNATYDITQNTLTYTILKSNTAARDRITLILEGKARPLDFNPLLLKYDQNSTIVTLNYKTSVTLKLGEQETANPYVANYETSLLTNSSLSTTQFSFNISAPTGTTSTTQVYAGNRGKPSLVFVNGVQNSEGENWAYNSTSNLVTVTWTHSSPAVVILDWALALSVGTTGSGSVDLNNTGPYFYGNHVLLTANPTSGWNFDHWEGNLSGSVNPAVLTMAANMSVTAVFTRIQYTLSVNVSGKGSTNATGNSTHNALENVTILAIPQSGYYFNYWIRNGSNVGSGNPYTINMTANYNLTAVFSAVMKDLNVTVVGNGVTNATGVNNYAEFTTVTVLATPDSGYQFDHWMLNASNVGSQNPYTINMTDNFELTAVFTRVQYTLIVSVSGHGITNATGTALHDALTNVTISATADSGNFLDHWSLNGTVFGMSSLFTVNMTANFNLTAVFLPVQHTLTVSVVGKGSTNATGAYAHDEYTNVSVLATPASGSYLDHWLLNGTNVGSSNPYIVNMTTNYNLTAVFLAVQRTLTVSVSGSGSTNATGTFEYPEFSNVTVLATPDSGWNLDHWILNGSNVGSVNPYKINMTADYVLTGVFAPPGSYLVVRGENDIIYYRGYNRVSLTWESWSAFPEGATVDSPASAFVGDELFVVVRGVNDDQIWFSYLNVTDNAFSGWTLLDGATPSAPTLTANSTTLGLVVRGTTDLIWYRFYDISSKVWTDWTSVPNGATPNTPGAALTSSTLQIVVRGVNFDEIWHSYVNLTDNSFGGWTLLDGQTPSAPTLTANGTSMYLVVRGESDVIWYRNYNFSSKGWNEWISLPEGATPDTPAATLTGNTLQIVVRGMSEDQIWHGYVNLSNGSFGGWALLDGATPSKPTLAS